MSSRILAMFEDGLFAYRRQILLLFIALTLFLGYSASQLRIDAGFKKNLPIQHPFIQSLLHYQQDFGGTNRVLIAIRAKQGDIFTAPFFDTIKAVTDEVFFFSGIDRSTVRSIFTPNVRFVEIVEGGFVGGKVIPADFSSTPEGLEQIRKNILKSRIVGRLVANDFTAAAVSAQLVETDPATGKHLNYVQVAKQLEDRIRGKYAHGNVDIHIIGFVKVVGDIAEGALGVVMFFGVAFLTTAGLVYLLTHSWRLTFVGLLCSLIAVIWTLGLLTLLGFGLDPMSILLPFLIFAIGVSHGLQMINEVRTEMYDGADTLTAARGAFRRLLIPGGVALGTDAIGFFTMYLIDIQTIRELALTATLGVMAILMTNLFLLPVLLSYLNLGEGYRDRLVRSAAQRLYLWKTLASAAEPKVATWILVSTLVLLIGGMFEAQNIKIGDLQPGVPELHADSRYNQDAGVISEKFSIGVDVLTIFAETVADACINHEVMDGIDRFQWHAANVEGVQSTMSMPQVAKTINVGWNEGNLKWSVLPRNPQTMVQAVSPIETSTGLLNQDCSVMPIYIFLKDHKSATINRVVRELQAFAKANPSNQYAFRFAGGNIGVMAATNQVVENAQVRMLVWVYAAVVGLCLLTFGSWKATLCIVTPLGLVSVLMYGLMSFLNIGLKISTLPVVVLGVGIGVDYGIYILSRLKKFLDEGLNLQEAYFKTIRVTGDAVLVTGLTLAAGVSTWVFSALKFQADMGMLLTFLFLANMLGALLLLPSLALSMYSVLGPKQVPSESVQD